MDVQDFDLYSQDYKRNPYPTLAAMLEIETPSGSIGRILSEIFENVAQPAR